MAARWPTMEDRVEPIPGPWVRGERLLRAHRGASEAADQAWLAFRKLVNGGLHGDDDTRWIGQVLSITGRLDPSILVGREARALDIALS